MEKENGCMIFNKKKKKLFDEKPRFMETKKKWNIPKERIRRDCDLIIIKKTIQKQIYNTNL
jgi:hypothetical protein